MTRQTNLFLFMFKIFIFFFSSITDYYLYLKSLYGQYVNTDKKRWYKVFYLFTLKHKKTRFQIETYTGKVPHKIN